MTKLAQLRKIAKLGGLARAAKLTEQRRIEIARSGGLAKGRNHRAH